MIDTSRWGMTTAAIGNVKLKFALLLLCFANAAATNNLITQRCSVSDNFTSGNTFDRNLNAVLTSLTANSIPAGFNATISGDSPDVVYGLALCRGDLTSDDCQTCVSNSAAQLVKLCPTTRDAIIWYEFCELRYSYTNFFGVVDTGPRVDWRWVNRNVTNITLFNNRLGVLLDNLTSMATSDPSALMFATGAIRLSDLQKIYGLVQCTRDLTLEDCKSCLEDAIGYIPKCCGGTEGAHVLKGSCNVRFDTNNFYFPNRPAPNPSPTLNPPDASASPSGSPAGSPNSTEDSNQPRRKPNVIPISISIPLIFFVCVAAYIIWYWKNRKPHPQTDTSGILTVESLLFDFCSIETATDNFSDANKLGQGGYGPVYKGKLPNGQEIAVKRLSSNSGQGATEFKNEVLLAAKLQHRNLVRILGCCLERLEKMLITSICPKQ